MLLDFPPSRYNTNDINENDIVLVKFNTSGIAIEEKLIVLRMPDNYSYWLLKGEETGNIFRINEPCTVEKIRSAGSSV